MTEKRRHWSERQTRERTNPVTNQSHQFQDIPVSVDQRIPNISGTFIGFQQCNNLNQLKTIYS